MAISDRRGKFKMTEDVAFSNDPVVSEFFSQVRIYDACRKDGTVTYRALSTVFDEVGSMEQEPTYDLYVENGKLYAERNDY